MKRMYWIANCLLLIGMLQTGCQDRTVGFLDIRHAAYAPDSMIVKAGLDPDNDAYQIKFKIPWQSGEMEGVEGTNPVKYTIRNVRSEHPEAVAQFRMFGRGRVELPWNHTVPVGRYVIDMRISNEGHFCDLDSIFIVIVR